MHAPQIIMTAMLAVDVVANLINLGNNKRPDVLPYNPGLKIIGTLAMAGVMYSGGFWG